MNYELIIIKSDFRRFVVPGGPVDSVDINAADTLAILDFELDESIIAPALAPRVLQLPVVLVALSICFSRAFFSLFFAAYPPVFDTTFLDFLITGAFGVSNDCHSVVDRHSIFITAIVITALF